MHALCHVQNVLLTKRRIKGKLQVALWIKPHQRAVVILFFGDYQQTLTVVDKHRNHIRVFCVDTAQSSRALDKRTGQACLEKGAADSSSHIIDAVIGTWQRDACQPDRSGDDCSVGYRMV